VSAVKKIAISIAILLLLLCTNILTYTLVQRGLDAAEKSTAIEVSRLQNKVATCVEDAIRDSGLAQPFASNVSAYDGGDYDSTTYAEGDTDERDSDSGKTEGVAVAQPMPSDEAELEEYMAAASGAYRLNRRTQHSTPTEQPPPAGPAAGNNVPVPELPLWEGDFEVFGDNGGLENIALPVMPEHEMEQ
jgi:hypothetical protein